MRPAGRPRGAARAGGSWHLLRAGVGATAGIGALCAAGFGAARGWSGALGAAVAAAAVAAFFLSGAAPVLLVDRHGRASPLALPLVLASYLLRLVLLAVVLTRLAPATGFDRPAFGITVVVCTLGWLLTTTVSATTTQRDLNPAEQQSGPERA